MDYKGKIVKLTTGPMVPAAEYICTSQYGGHIEIAPLEPMNVGQLDFPPLPITGPNAIEIVGCREDKELIERTHKEYRDAVLSWESGNREEDFVNVILGIKSVDCVKHNLARLDALADYRTGKNEVFKDIYGTRPLDQDEKDDLTDFFNQMFGLSIPEGFQEVGRIDDEVMLEPIHEECCDGKCQVGRVLFVEFGELFGDFIVIEQSDKYLYGVWAVSVSAGYVITRLPIEEINVLSSREDDHFIEAFAFRLDNMEPDIYPAMSCDAAQSVFLKLGALLDDNDDSRDFENGVMTIDGVSMPITEVLMHF